MSFVQYQMFLTTAWNIALLLLTFCVWKRVRHWSGLTILCSLALLVVLRMVYPTQLLFWWMNSQWNVRVGIPDLPNAGIQAVVSVAWPLAYSLGIIGSVGAIVALRKKGWNIQSLRNQAEVAQA